MKLLDDRVLVRPRLQAPPQTDSGIQIAESYYHVPEVRGIVVAVGDGPTAEDGTRLPHLVSPGDDVLFAPEAGHDIVLDSQRFIILRELDILAILD
jgi:co-chaperonin GroES (HSP10)